MIEPTGADTLAYLELGGKTAVARLQPQDVDRAGINPRLAIDMNRASLFDPASGQRIE